MSLEPYFADFRRPEPKTTFEFRFKRSRLWNGLIAVCALAALAILSILASGLKDHFHLLVIYLPLLLSCAFILPVHVARLNEKGAALVISTLGLRIADYSNETIPWLDIDSVTRTRVGRRDFLDVRLDPKRESKITRSGLFKYLGWLIGQNRDRATINLRLLDCLAEIPTKKIDVYLAAAKAARDDEFLRCGLVVPVIPPAPALMNGLPWFTISASVLLCAVYAAEVWLSGSWERGHALTALRLDAFGGSNYAQVFGDAEWWRLFTAPLLHASFLHILSNVIVLIFTGIALERFIGWRWTSATFAASALIGALGSSLLNSPHMVGVGASGGIMGLLAALFVLSYRLEPGSKRHSLQLTAARVIVPALIPLAAQGKEHVDYICHACGGAAGALVAALIFMLWPRANPEPRFARAAALFSLAFFCIGIGALALCFREVASAETSPAYKRAGQPVSKVPSENPALEAVKKPTVSSDARPPNAALNAAVATGSPTNAVPIKVGDFWRYDIRDEITGNTAKVGYVVTDVKADAVAVRVNTGQQAGQTGFLTYDSDWNGLTNGHWNFLPSDGAGMPRSLYVGEAWSFDGDAVDWVSSHSRHRHLTSRVAGTDVVETTAGKFNTYRIETSWTASDDQNPDLQFNYTQTTWFDPAIDHWVKRYLQVQTDGLTRSRSTTILTAYGHSKG